ncbi:hypothetical protein K2W90_01200 [Candidatus Babeliales bacterium]|nr:hypothetical protein [Candidatus Babeliales bacterium]
MKSLVVLIVVLSMCGGMSQGRSYEVQTGIMQKDANSCPMLLADSGQEELVDLAACLRVDDPESRAHLIEIFSAFQGAALALGIVGLFVGGGYFLYHCWPNSLREFCLLEEV